MLTVQQAGLQGKLKDLQKEILQEHLVVPLPSPIFSSFSYFCIAVAARGPLRALGSKTPGPALQRRRHPSLRSCPAPLPAHGLLGLVVLGRQVSQ